MTTAHTRLSDWCANPIPDATVVFVHVERHGPLPDGYRGAEETAAFSLPIGEIDALLALLTGITTAARRHGIPPPRSQSRAVAMVGRQAGKRPHPRCMHRRSDRLLIIDIRHDLRVPAGRERDACASSLPTRQAGTVRPWRSRMTSSSRMQQRRKLVWNVADRFHLLKNLQDALERARARHHTALRAACPSWHTHVPRPPHSCRCLRRTMRTRSIPGSPLPMGRNCGPSPLDCGAITTRCLRRSSSA